MKACAVTLAILILAAIALVALGLVLGWSRVEVNGDQAYVVDKLVPLRSRGCL